MSPQNNPNNLPVFFDPRTPGAATTASGPSVYFSPDITPESATLPLSHYLYILRRQL